MSDKPDVIGIYKADGSVIVYGVPAVFASEHREHGTVRRGGNYFSAGARVISDIEISAC